MVVEAAAAEGDEAEHTVGEVEKALAEVDWVQRCRRSVLAEAREEAADRGPPWPGRQRRPGRGAARGPRRRARGAPCGGTGHGPEGAYVTSELLSAERQGLAGEEGRPRREGGVVGGEGGARQLRRGDHHGGHGAQVQAEQRGAHAPRQFGQRVVGLVGEQVKVPDQRPPRRRRGQPVRRLAAMPAACALLLCHCVVDARHGERE